MRSVGDTKTTLLVAPLLHNSSCTKAHNHVTTGGVIQATFILLLSTGIFAANLWVILVINSRRYAKYIHQQPRYLLTSLASNDLAIGVLVTPFGFLPALFRCWPYNETLCQIQALLRCALTQQSAAILVCMAIDRYACMLHPTSYHKHSTKKGCMTVLSMTLVASLTVYSAIVLPKGGYYFNVSGLGACDAFYTRASLRILAACFFYFPTTMLLMYCYGSAFHAKRLRIKVVASSGGDANNVVCNKMNAQERRLSLTASRTMAAMSLGFIVMVTPWTIQEVVVACTGTKMPEFLDFVITWLALSNSFWNPLLYWLMNNNFRRISRELFFTKVLCRNKRPPNPSNSLQCCSLPATAMMPTSLTRDMEGLSEKYWGEILERTVSSSSLQISHQHHHHHHQQLQKNNATTAITGYPPPPPPPPPPRTVK